MTEPAPLEHNRAVSRMVLAALEDIGRTSIPERLRAVIPDRAWFDQAIIDEMTVPHELPRLFWLCLEVLRRLNPATPVEDADPWLDTLMTPDTLRPSSTRLKAFRERLGQPDGSEKLEFARDFVREACLVNTEIESGSAYLPLVSLIRCPRLYRAVVLEKLSARIAARVRAVGSIQDVAAGYARECLEKEGFRHSMWLVSDLMCMDGNQDVRRFGVRNHWAWSIPHVMRGCLSMIAAAGDPGDVEWLVSCAEQIAERSIDVGGFNRIVRTVGLIGGLQAVRQLARLKRRVRHSVMLGQIDAALADASAASGLTITEAEEYAAADWGLEDDQTRRETLAEGYFAVLQLGPTGSPRITYEDAAAKPIGRLPPSVKDEARTRTVLTALKADRKALAADMAVHRFRLERSWLNGEAWRAEAFRERWLDHKLLRWFALRQIWTVTDPAGTDRTCLILGDGTTLDADGNAAPPLPAGAIVRLWHPITATGTDLTARWRRTVQHLDITQPIRQAWREIYTLTQSERETSPDSRRYALRVLHQFQAIALGRPRGWRIRTLVAHLPSSESESWMLLIPGYGLCAEFRTAGVGAFDQGHEGPGFRHILTDRVRFRLLKDRGDWRRDGARKLTITETPVRLDEIEPIVFAEVMRDLDLFVSTASTTMDVDPDALLLAPEIGAWRRQAGLAEMPLPREPHFGNVALMRREILETILPDMVPHGAVTLENRHAIVHGRRHDYEVHLGSGDVFLLPQRHQLVLPSRSRPEPAEPPRFCLPLHDDPRLHVVVETILMLTRDDKIRDKALLAQLEIVSR